MDAEPLSSSQDVPKLQSPSDKGNGSISDNKMPKYESYKQLIDAYAPFIDYFACVQKFFMDESLDSRTPTISTIMDFTNESLTEAGPFTAATASFCNAISSRSPEIKTRLILTAYSRVKDANRGIFDALGHCFDVDPAFFEQHLHPFNASMDAHHGTLLDPFKDDDLEAYKPLLPSEERSIYHFSFTRYSDFMSAYVHEDPATKFKTGDSYLSSVVVSQRASIYRSAVNAERVDKSVYAYEAKTLYIRYLATLRRMTKQEISTGCVDVLVFFYPYIRDLVYVYFARYRELYNTETPVYFSGSWKQSKSLPFVYDGVLTKAHDLDQIKIDIAALYNLRDNIARICSSLELSGAREKYHRLQKDRSIIIRKYEASATQYKESKTNEVMEAQIKEARASAEQAVSVTRLSKLAFVFIPLSFTSSLFGMNIVEMGQGTVPLQYFIITAIAVSICSLLPMLPSFVRSFRSSGFLRDVQNFWGHSKAVVMLSVHSRKVAYWYAVLCFRFERPIFMYICGQRVEEAILKKRNKEQSYAVSRDLVRLKILETGNPYVWTEKGQMILDFCDDYEGHLRTDALKSIHSTTW